MFEKMLSVGPISREDEMYKGYNGVTNQEGVSTGDWINEKQGVLAFHIDRASKSYFIGVKTLRYRAWFEKHARDWFSGQKKSLWNDDIGEEGFATIDLSSMLE